MGKNIVVCCDGTGNQIGGHSSERLSSVFKLFRIARKNDSQRVYYNPGVGTIGLQDEWVAPLQSVQANLGLATGYGLDDYILDAYRFLMEQYREGDRIFLFGFSRGAYTVRALAGLIHMIGLLPPDQSNIATYALGAYKRVADGRDFTLGWLFGRETGTRHIVIDFIGVWDTVASMIAPRWYGIIPAPRLRLLPYTRTNSSVMVFRHAIAIDERRRMFRLNRWAEPQRFAANRSDKSAPIEQDIKQVWFAGVHGDIGGGYPEVESGLSKFPLNWMIDEAVKYGLDINTETRNHIALGQNHRGAREIFVKPDATAKLHVSLTAAWRPLEWIPKRVKYEEWKWRLKLYGFYIPDGEPRPFKVVDPYTHTEIEKTIPRIHQSVFDRMDMIPDYRPINLLPEHPVEPWPH
jgi:uncharacterized protein (DUF2235 family)